jgi:hypothetical protein
VDKKLKRVYDEEVNLYLSKKNFYIYRGFVAVLKLFKKCLFFHKWKIDKDTGFTIYRRCMKCGKKEIKQRGGGYQPIDKTYLEEGDFSETRFPPTYYGVNSHKERKM